MNKNLISQSLFGVVLVAFVMAPVFTPRVVAAQTTVNNYQPNSVNELIAYLYGVIASLEAQKTTGGTSGAVVSSQNSSRADVETLSVASIRKSAVTFRSSIDFGTASYVYAYFEYGTSKSMNESTIEKRLTKSSKDTYTITVDDLRSNTTYYYRAVIETPSGAKIYGSLRSFKTTGSNSNSSSNRGDDELSTDESEYERGDTITVSYEFEDDERDSGSWVGLYRENDSDTAYRDWKYVSSDSGEVRFTAPSQSGEYEFRLFSDGGYDRVAVSDTFTID